MDNIITHFFPSLTPLQQQQFSALQALYTDWNSKINVISRKDIDNLYEHHVLHSLAIAAFLGQPVDGTSIVDVGTGGGFPGIPLAIMYPQVQFHLVDRIAKKLRVASGVASAIGLKNVTFQHGDMGECHTRFDYAVSRAVMRLDALVKLVRGNISPESRNEHPNGLICLKGGDLTPEMQDIRYPVVEYPVTEFFPLPFFDTKTLVYVPMATKRRP